jgi:hypothetical protein
MQANNCFSRAKARTTYERPKLRGLERRLQALLCTFLQNSKLHSTIA